MGYYTRYSGELTITPPLTKPEYLRLAQTFVFWNSEAILQKARADVFDATVPELTPEDKSYWKGEFANAYDRGFSFNLTPAKLIPQEDEMKCYHDRDILPVIAQWLEANHHALEGTITWTGSCDDDHGTLYAKPIHNVNRVEWVDDIVSNPGPSWDLSPDSLSPLVTLVTIYGLERVLYHLSFGEERERAAARVIVKRKLALTKGESAIEWQRLKDSPV